MKLELKHLAPYLPYSLKGYVFYTEEDFEVITLSLKDGVDNEVSINDWLTGYVCKPILHPLSDLTKEIEVNGEKFVPIDKIREEDRDWLCIENDEYIFREDVGGGGWIGYITFDRIPYWIIEKLFEWHFDIFVLIAKGLAIDINSLPQSSE